MRVLLVTLLALALGGCSKPKQRHHFVSAGIKDLPLILLDQDTGRICYAGDSPAPGEYFQWYNANVGRGTPQSPSDSDSYFFCSDVVWNGERPLRK